MSSLPESRGCQMVVNCALDERLTSCLYSRRAGACAPALTCNFVGGGGPIRALTATLNLPA
jgi:hypothetical protein